MNNIIDLIIQLYLLYIENNKQIYYNNFYIVLVYLQHIKKELSKVYRYALYWSKKLISDHLQFFVLDRLEVVFKY